MTNAVSMRWASMRQTSQESKGSSSTHFRPLKKNHKDSQAHYLEDDHKAIKYLWWHLVQNNCFRFKTSPGELPKSSSNFRYCSDIPSRIDGTLTALMQGADFISEGPTVSQTAHSAFKCKTSDLCWATQQKPFGFSMSSFSWQEKSFSLPFSLPAPVPQFRDLSEEKRQPAAKPWPNQLPAVRFLTGERAALPEQGKHPGLGKRRHWGDSTGWGGSWNLSSLFPAQRLPCSPGCWMAFCAINSFKKTKRNSGSCSRVLKIISRCSPKIPGQVRQSKCNLNAAFRQDQPADTEVRHKMLPFPCSLHQCHSSF